MVLTKENIFASQKVIDYTKTELQRKIWLKESLENKYEIPLVPFDISEYHLSLWHDEIGLTKIDQNQDDPYTDAFLTWEEFLDPEFDTKINSLLAAKKEAEDKEKKKKESKEFLLYQKLKKKFEKQVYLTKSHIRKLLRSINDKTYALIKMRPVEPYFSSKTLIERYAFFVWDFGVYK